MEFERLSLIAIKPSESDLAPPGIHLRWSFPPSWGFPPKGFELYRSHSSRFAWTTLHWPASLEDLVSGGQLSNPLQGDGWIVAFSNIAKLYPVGSSLRPLSITQQGGTQPGKLQIHLTEPVVRVRVHLRGVSGSVYLKAYAGKRLTDQHVIDATQAGASVTLRVDAPWITTVELPLNGFTTLDQVDIQTEKAICNSERWGNTIQHLPLVQSEGEALGRLENGLSNYYAPSQNAAYQRYGNKLADLLGWLRVLLQPEIPSEASTDFRTTPDQLSLRLNNAPDALISELKPQSMLLLSAVDPNIARFLSLYWVDRFDDDNGPENSKLYDYKIVGLYEDGPRCGLALSIGQKTAPLPTPGLSIDGEQLAGIHWQNQTPIGRVQLRWSPSLSPDLQVQVTRPVCYDIKRIDEVLNVSSQHLTKEQPVLASNVIENNTHTISYIDQHAPIGQYDILQSGALALFTYRYEVSGIDIFGQVGQPVSSPPIQMGDLAAPPAPIRLKARLLQPGYPWRGPAWSSIRQDQQRYTAELEAVFGSPVDMLRAVSDTPAAVDLFFEYGPSQVRQAPDARSFHVYWRPDTLLETSPIDIVTTTRSPGKTRIQVHANAPLQSFEGGFVTSVNPESSGNSDLSLLERQRIAIQAVPDQQHLVVNEQWQPEIDQPYWVIANPYNRMTWNHTGRRVAVQAPLQGQSTVDPILHTTGIIHQPEPQSNSLALMPPSETRSAQAFTVPDVTEIFLNLSLLEPGLLTGGSAEINGYPPLPILYSTAGNAISDNDGLPSQQTTRIGISRIPTAPVGQTVSVTLRSPDSLSYLTYEWDKDRDILIVDHALALPTADYLATAMVRIGNQRYSILTITKQANQLHLRLNGGHAKLAQTNFPNTLTIEPMRLLQVSLDQPLPEENLQFNGGRPGEFARRGPGGELAWQKQVNGKLTLARARVVSDLWMNSGQSSLLIQTTNPNLEAELEGQKCNYYASYWVRLVIDVGQTTALHPHLPIGMDQATRNAYFAVQTSDNPALENLNPQTAATNFGPLSAPAQITALRPPVFSVPDPPIPCQAEFDSNDLEAGYATPPDHDGRATVCLKWRYENDSTALEGIRFEVARALDATIVAAAKRAWQRGDLTHAPQLQRESLTLSGTLTLTADNSADAERFTTVRLATAIADNITKQALIGGRLQQQDAYGRVLQATIDGDRAAVNLRIEVLRGEFQVGTATLTSSPTVEGRPIWEHLQGDTEALRQLAMAVLKEDTPLTLIDEAFGVVTGVPLVFESGQELRFRDEIPGIGRNKFFYCVRAVDKAEQRSPWSGVSVPFYQLDMLRPAVPVLVNTDTAKGQRKIFLQRPLDRERIMGYRLKIADIESDDLQPWLTFLFNSNLDDDNHRLIGVAHIYAFRHLVDIRPIANDHTLSLDDFPRITGVFRKAENADIATGNNLLTDTARLVNNILLLAGIDELDGQPLVLNMQFTADGEVISFASIDHLCRISLNETDLIGKTLYIEALKEIGPPDKTTVIASEAIRVL